MGYLKTTVKDLEREFIPLFENINNPILDIYPELPISITPIIECTTFYGVEGNGEDIEKTTIQINDFNPKNKLHKFNVNYDLLKEKLDIEVFNSELTINIEEQGKEYYFDLKHGIEKSQNDITLKGNLANAIESINQSILSLEKLSLNSIQFQVAKLYLKSYKKLLADLKRDYNVFCPELFFNNTSIKDFDENEFFNKFFKNQLSIKAFVKFEKQLIRYKYLDDNLNWLKSKISLVRFFKFCFSEGLIKVYFEEESDVLHYLEKRYSIDLGDQSKPSKFKKVQSFKGEFSFLK